MVQRESYNGFAESISKSICDLSSGFQQILWVHEEGTPNRHHRDFNVRNNNIPSLTNSSYPQPLLQPHTEVQHLPAEVVCEERKKRKGEKTFLSVSRLSMWIAQYEYDANRQDQEAIFFIKQRPSVKIS